MNGVFRLAPDHIGRLPQLSAIRVFAVSNSGDFDRIVDIVIEENPVIGTAEPETRSGMFKPLHVSGTTSPATIYAV